MRSVVQRGLTTFARAQLPIVPRTFGALRMARQQQQCRALCQSPSASDGGGDPASASSPPQEQQQQQRRQAAWIDPLEERMEREEEDVKAAIWERLNRASPEPRLRSPVPEPPTTHLETWANRAYISEIPDENVLSFRTRFYIDSTGEQPEYSNKVQLVVKLAKLGLTPLEERRLIAVALPNYHRKRKELHFSTQRYDEVGRNKEFLRRRFASLLEDARENAEGHDLIPDEELPLAARRRPWLPRDTRVGSNRPKRKLNQGSPG